MAYYIYKRTVAFHEADPAGIARFTVLLCYVEEAEMAFMKDAGLAFFAQDCGWPRVKLQVDYVSSVHVGDEMEVMIRPNHVGKTSLEWVYQIMCKGKLVLSGMYVTVRMGEGWAKQSLSQQERDVLMPWCAGG